MHNASVAPAVPISLIRHAKDARQQLVSTAQRHHSVIVVKATHSTSQILAAPLEEELRPHGALLTEFARRYIWWLSPEEALEFPARVVAQVMNIGVFQDAARLAEALGDDGLRAVLRQAEAGQFNARSWHYWHYRLGLAEPGQVPPLPVRRIP